MIFDDEYRKRWDNGRITTGTFPRHAITLSAHVRTSFIRTYCSALSSLLSFHFTSPLGKRLTHNRCAQLFHVLIM
jgi:hypothetical protein